MREQGYKQMTLWLDKLEVAGIWKQAARENLAPAAWVRLKIGELVKVLQERQD